MRIEAQNLNVQEICNLRGGLGRAAAPPRVRFLLCYAVPSLKKLSSRAPRAPLRGRRHLKSSQRNKAFPAFAADRFARASRPGRGLQHVWAFGRPKRANSKGPRTGQNLHRRGGEKVHTAMYTTKRHTSIYTERQASRASGPRHKSEIRK